MSEAQAKMFLLQGDDEFAIAQALKKLEQKFSNTAAAAMNQTTLDGKATSAEELFSVAGAMPFLADYRLVTVINATAKYEKKETQKKFEAVLDKIPSTTVLVLVEHYPKDPRDYKGGWLEKWFQQARQAEKHVQVNTFMLPKGAELTKRILDLAKQKGGKFTPRAADALAGLIGSDPRLAEQEIEKLLAYVNYQRQVEHDDVEALTADTAEGNVFTLVDALALQQGPKAMNMLQRLLEQTDASMIFGMVVRQFRLLILARDAMERGANEAEIAKQTKLHPYVVGKSIPQARRFKLADLETVYRRLLDMDEEIKKGQISTDLALETFVAAFTTPPVGHPAAR